jgi:hypothetical protein
VSWWPAARSGFCLQGKLVAWDWARSCGQMRRPASQPFQEQRAGVIIQNPKNYWRLQIKDCPMRRPCSLSGRGG